MTLQEFYVLIGGNYQEALGRLMNEQLITRMLVMFKQTNSYGDIVSGYEEKDYKKIFEASHSLKGVAGNLSLTPLFSISSAICEKVRNYENLEVEDLEKEMEELNFSYVNIISKIDQLG